MLVTSPKIPMDQMVLERTTTDGEWAEMGSQNYEAWAWSDVEKIATSITPLYKGQLGTVLHEEWGTQVVDSDVPPYGWGPDRQTAEEAAELYRDTVYPGQEIIVMVRYVSEWETAS